MNASPDSAELEALRLSLEVAVRSVGFSLPLAVLAAWVLTRARFPGRLLLDAFVHLPLVLPPVAVGYVLLLLFGARGPLGAWLRTQFGVQLAFTTAGAAGLGEFGAVITFASNVPGVTRTLPLALYTAMQSPGGDALALRLAILSFALGLTGLLAAEFLVRRVRRYLGG